ncbi:Acyl-CoA N-acyltransferase [Naviculisporaceae sp. PSN 640]
MAPPRTLADYAASSDPILKLPHPYQTPYFISKTPGSELFQIHQQTPTIAETHPLPVALDNPSLYFSEPKDLKSSDRPHGTINTAWGRARRSPSVTVSWKGSQTPTVGELWLITYTVFTIRLKDESFRLLLQGTGSELLTNQLKAVSLAIEHPAAPKEQNQKPQTAEKELVILRSAFWQGAGSPFGPRPVWCPLESDCLPNPSSFPLPPTDYTLTQSTNNNPGGSTNISWHPRRPAKPRPGSTIYSRYIPHLGETFSMAALDYTNPEHVSLFHTWQNDPRVSQGWNQTGTLAQHREYLRQLHSDPSKLAILARFDDTYFAYFEIYWAKEDPIGAFYTAGDYDRGRHSLVGDVRYRGPHRVSAWWSSLMHYLFLDEPRTMSVVGEPKYTNSSVLMYDLMHGFGLDKFLDLPYKRSGLMTCSREKFFQLCPFDENEKVMGGTGVGLVPKL